MPSLHLSIRAALGALTLLAAGAGAQAANACATRDSCLDAIMEAASTGHQIEQMALMRTLARDYGTRTPLAAGRPAPQAEADAALAVGDAGADLIGLLRGAGDLGLAAASRRRALALAYLQAGRLADAELELDEAIANQPTHAPFWLDLALVYARQGRTARAAAALLVAGDWTLDADVLRQAYARAAQRSTPPGAGAPYVQALELIAARDASLAQREAALAPRPLPPAPERKPGAMPLIIFDSCARPEYPLSSLRNEETGRVTLHFLVDAGGKAVQIRKISSSGHADLDNAALLSLSACGFKPLVLEDKPVAAWAAVQYVWTLD